jgi:environmental stress-induced protein Ves
MVISGPTSIGSAPSVSWKNGGGTTRTLVVEPAGAGLDDFLWRISMAEIHASGGFSAFPGIERTILLWRGEGVVLRSPAWPEHVLTELYQPFGFSGEEDVICELVGGSTVDLNLMIRRGVARAAINIHKTEIRLDHPYNDVVVLCAAGRVRILLNDRPELALDADQFLRISQVDAGVTIIPEGAGATFVCAIVHLLD